MSEEGFKSLRYTAYLVRLWQESPHAPWRVSAQCVQTGEKSYFATLAAFYAFLDDQTAQWSTAEPPARPDAS